VLVNYFLENSAARLPDKIALICAGQKIAYRRLNESADKFASALIEMDVRRQDRVIIFLDNSVEAVIALFGILKAGATFIMLNATMKANKLNFILKDSGARAIVTHERKGGVVNKAVEGVDQLKCIIWCPDANQHKETKKRPKNFSWSALLEKPYPVQYEKFPRTIDVNIATIIYTSGSTGRPKGVVSAHYNVVAVAKSVTSYLENVESDIILNALPLSFDYGLYQVLMTFLLGGTLVLESSFLYPYRVVERLVLERVTGFPIVPTMLAILLQMENLSKFDFSSLRYISNTAAALPISHIRKMQKLFAHVKIFSMYGLTECKRVSYLPPEYLSTRPDSVGLAIPNTEVFIVDANGDEVCPGEVGELVVSGSNVMQGYWNLPEETATTFRPRRFRSETLLYTGDLFRKDEEGFLYFVGRKDDMIKTKGERVSPKEIENVLFELEDVSEAAVIGVPDKIFGQVITAYIVLKKGKRLTDKAVLKYCTANLEPFMVPKYIEFRDAFPKSSSGKIDKKKLRGGFR